MSLTEPPPNHLKYRRRAAELAHQAYEADDPGQQLELIGEALKWIKLAESEEFIAEAAQR